MNKKLFTLSDLKGADTIDIPFVSMLDITGKPIIISNTEMSELTDNFTGEMKPAVRLTFAYESTPDEILQTISTSYIFKNFHDLISEQKLYPILITITSEGKRYKIT